MSRAAIFASWLDVNPPGQVRWGGSERCAAAADAGGREPAVETDRGGTDAGHPGVEDGVGKKVVKPAAMVSEVRVQIPMSERRACQLVLVQRSSVRYRRRRGDDAALRSRLRELAMELV